MRRLWSRLHFLIRFLGLTGVLVGAVGAVLVYLHGLWPGIEAAWRESWPALAEQVRTLLTDSASERAVTVYLVAGGAAAALVALLVELVSGVFLATGRRGAFGFNATAQIALALALLVGVNWYSFEHYRKFVWTTKERFTLSDTVQTELRKLQGDTTILIYLMGTPTGPLTRKVDAYEAAAARNVVEKVKDLVDQLRELGGRFKVEVLDREEEGFAKRLGELTKDDRTLRDAIEAAPENSIFFNGRDKVQRLSFSEFYRLDKVASLADNNGRGNLVLLYQTEEPFANRILGIEEKRPKIGIAVVHEWLTTQGLDDYGLKGLKQALTAHGFDVQDILLKKWSEFAPPEPGVYTYDEVRFDRLDEELTELNEGVKLLEREIELSLELEKVWSTSTPEELSKRYAKQLAQARRKSITEEMRKAELGSIRTTLAFERLQLNQYRQARDEVAKEKATLNVDHAAEQRRVTDLKAKLERALADCDLLLIPRMTLRNINTEERIPNRVYRLEDAQVEALKEFLKAGKPLLACFGPTNEPADRMRGDPTPPGPDRLEELLVELGVKFGKQTVLFGTDSKSFAERRSGLQIAGTNIKPPPVSFDWEPGTGRPKDLTPPTDAAPHQIRESMRITARGTTQKLDLNIRHPRPIYFEPGGDQKLTYQPEFLMSDRDSWNEENPFPSRERTPRFDVPKKEDPAKGTLDERRRGPFPLGVAADVKLPASWYADSKTNAATTRLAVIGHGGFFVGPELKPVEEQMLLHTCNWLLGRDDRLPQQGHVWKYPRVDLTEREQTLWWLGTQFGLPALFVYLGMVVWLVRRLR